MSFLIGHFYDISTLSSFQLAVVLFLAQQFLHSFNLQQIPWEHSATGLVDLLLNNPLKTQNHTQGGSCSCVVGLVLIVFGLLGVGLAIGMFFPWTGKENQSLLKMLNFLLPECDGKKGGEQGQVYDQDTTPSTHIPKGTPSNKNQPSLKIPGHLNILTYSRALDLFKRDWKGVHGGVHGCV